MGSFSKTHLPTYPSQEDAEEAVRTLLRWSGVDPQDQTLLATPTRVVTAYRELCAGYEMKPRDILQPTCQQVDDYEDIILLRNVHFDSLCEHHLSPFTGVAQVAYIPNQQIVGISKLALLVECFARRLQLQERLTMQIAQSIQQFLQPKGAAVIVKAQHNCVRSASLQPHIEFVSQHFTGCFRDSTSARDELYQLLRTSTKTV